MFKFLKRIMKFLPVVDEAFLLTQQNNFEDIYKKYFKNKI